MDCMDFMTGLIGEELWQVLRMYDVGGKLLNGIKSIYVNSLACVKVKGDGNECFRIDNGVRQGCIMIPWLFHVHMNAVIKEVKIEMWRSRVRFRRRKKSGNCLASCMQMTWFYVVSRRKT